MSDSYEISGVTITVSGGGYYVLTHPSLAEPERVRGKETADARAVEIAQANPQPGEQDAPLSPGTLDPDAKPPEDITTTKSLDGKDAVPPIPATKPSPEAQAAASKAAEVQTPNLDPAVQDGEDPRDAQIRVLTEQMKMMMSTLQHVTTLIPQPGAPPLDQVPHSIPREYTGQMDPKAKKALNDAGINISTIVLEDNESIPPTGLFIGHNGRAYVIKPGEEVDVPDFLLGVLDDAVMSTPIVDPSSQKVLGYRDRSKYPYRRVTAKG